MSEAVFMTGEFAIAVHAIVYLNHKRSYLSSEALAKISAPIQRASAW